MPARLSLKTGIAAALLASLTFAATTAPTSARGRVEIVDYGLYDMKRVRVEPAPKQIAKQREIVTDIKLRRKTNRFTAQLGRAFGIRYRLRDRSLHGKRLTFRMIFPRPKLTNPKTGETRAYQDSSRLVRYGDVEFEGYGFDNRWELAEGVWTIQILYQGKVLVEQKFMVLVPLN